MDNVELRRVGRLASLTVRYGHNLEYADHYPVYTSQPDLITSYGPIYEPGNAAGAMIATGRQLREEGIRDVAWYTDPDEAAEINLAFREAIQKGIDQVWFADEED